MLNIGLSTCSKKIDDRLFADCSAAGIAAVEISPAQGHYDEIDFRAIRQLSIFHGIELWSFHLPFMPFEIIDVSSLDPEIRKCSVKYDSELIKKAAEIGIKKYVLHPSGEPITDAEREDRMKTACDSLSTLAQTATECGGVIAVENLPRTCLGKNSAEILRLLSSDDRLRACFDTNHLLSEPISDFIRNVGKKIVTTHISDYDFIDEKHWLPGEGKIDWPSLYRNLLSTGYDGVWMYELGFRAPASLSRARDLIPADYARNAHEIFDGRQITVIA